MKKVSIKINKNHPAIKEYSKAVERGMNSHHVVPRNTGWVVKKAGAKKATKMFTTQTEATQYAKKIAKNNKTSLFVHNKEGRIESRVDY